MGKFKVQLARGGVTCITFVQASYGQPPCLLVNTSDSSATIIDCTYGPPAGVLTNLTVRHRVKVAHSLLPLKCCYSPSGAGYLISGSEDKEVYIYSLGREQLQDAIFEAPLGACRRSQHQLPGHFVGE